ncbi:MAG: hypothetical protein JXD23_10060 [Spirochaetales bacterium]|nr:hypothetical protein [Spirochaetales bacterium]
MSLLRRFGLFGDVGNLKLQLGSSFIDLKKAYSLLYKVFLEEKYIEPTFMGLRLREWELDPAMATFIAKDGNSVVGMISLAPDLDGLGIPDEELFHEEIEEIRGSARILMESCNSAIDSRYRDRSLPSEFYRYMLAYAWHVGIDKVVGVVNRGHKAFYEFLYMKQYGPEKSYSQSHHDPIILIYTDCDLLYEYLSSPESDNGSADSFLRRYLLLENPYLAMVPAALKKARTNYKRQKIREQFQEEIKHTLVASVWNDAVPQKHAGSDREFAKGGTAAPQGSRT